jgi:hypothetical protein
MKPGAVAMRGGGLRDSASKMSPSENWRAGGGGACLDTALRMNVAHATKSDQNILFVSFRALGFFKNFRSDVKKIWGPFFGKSQRWQETLAHGGQIGAHRQKSMRNFFVDSLKIFDIRTKIFLGPLFLKFLENRSDGRNR